MITNKDNGVKGPATQTEYNPFIYMGFNTEEEYMTVSKIVLKAIEDYTESVHLELKENPVEKYLIITITTDEQEHFVRYFVNKAGVFYVNTESKNFPIKECKILVALHNCAKDLFDIVG